MICLPAFIAGVCLSKKTTTNLRGEHETKTCTFSSGMLRDRIGMDKGYGQSLRVAEAINGAQVNFMGENSLCAQQITTLSLEDPCIFICID